MYRVIRASESSEDDYIMNGHQFRIDGEYDVDYADDPKTAITKWFRMANKKSNRYNTCILVSSKENAQLLRDCVIQNPEWFENLYQKYTCGYKLEYLLESCKRKFGEYPIFRFRYPDQVDPFSIG